MIYSTLTQKIHLQKNSYSTQEHDYHDAFFIGASLSKPHTNRYYKKIAIVTCMYVCFACMRMHINIFFIIYIHYVNRVFCCLVTWMPLSPQT